MAPVSIAHVPQLQQWVMNWTSGWERPSAGPEVNKQFTVSNQIIFIDNTPAIIEIDLSRQTTQPSPVSEKEPGVEV